MLWNRTKKVNAFVGSVFGTMATKKEIVMTLAPNVVHFGSLLGAIFRLGCKSEYGAPVEMGTLLRPSRQTLLGVIFATFSVRPKK